MSFKKFWKNYWDDIVLIIGILLAVYLFLKARGIL